MSAAGQNWNELLQILPKFYKTLPTARYSQLLPKKSTRPETRSFGWTHVQQYISYKCAHYMKEKDRIDYEKNTDNYRWTFKQEVILSQMSMNKELRRNLRKRENKRTKYCCWKTMHNFIFFAGQKHTMLREFSWTSNGALKTKSMPSISKVRVISIFQHLHFACSQNRKIIRHHSINGEVAFQGIVTHICENLWHVCDNSHYLWVSCN